MVTNCLNKAYSYLPSFSEEDRAYYKGMAADGTVFAAGAFLGWNALINQNLFSWQNAAAALVGAYTFSGKSISVFPDFQSRVERLHKEISEANPAHIQQNIEAYKARCLALGRELVRLPEAKRTPYLTLVLLKMRDFLLASDAKSRSDLNSQLKRLYLYWLREKAALNLITLINKLWTTLPLAGAVMVGIFRAVGRYPVLSGLGTLILCANSNKFFAKFDHTLTHGNMLKACLKDNNIDALKDMTNTRDHRAFRACKDIPSFFRKLFPTSTPQLPKDWQKLTLNFSKTPILEKFEMEAGLLLKNKAKFSSWKDFFEKLLQTKDRSVNTLLQLLIKANPILKRAWELAGKPKVEERTSSSILTAHYQPGTHIISMNKELDILQKVGCLIFEIFNALQRRAIYEIAMLAKDQNECALLKEYVEYFTSNWFDKIMHSMGSSPPKNINFPEQWKIANSLAKKWGEIPEEAISHAERYRIIWMINYIFDNPGFLERRLRELQ